MSDVLKQYISLEYSDMVQIYTDGSKDPNSGRTGAAFYIPQLEKKIKQRTPDHLAIYTVEILAFLLAAKFFRAYTDSTIVTLYVLFVPSHAEIDDNLNCLAKISLKFNPGNLVVLFIRDEAKILINIKISKI